MSIVRGNTAAVSVDADRDSAYVFVDGVPAGVAPARVEMKRSSGHQVEVVRPGYLVARADVSRAFNPAAGAASFLLGGLGGVAVDVSTGAVYDLYPGAFTVALTPDSAGVQAPLVAERIRLAEAAARTGFAAADPRRRRRATPWLTVQTGAGVFVGDTRKPDGNDDGVTGTGGFGVGLAVGARTEDYSAQLRGVVGAGLVFDNSERWDVSALLGLVTESSDGRLRLGIAAGPGLSGGRESSVCFLCDERPDGDRARIPTRLGVAVEFDASAFFTPRVGFGVTVPVNYSLRDLSGGLMVGLRYQGL